MNDRELLEKAAKDEELAKVSARILGPSSAAQQALDEVGRIRADGNLAAIVNTGTSWVIVRAAASICDAEE